MIGGKIKEILKRRGLTIREGAEKCGFPFATFYSYVSGMRTPPVTALKKLSVGLKVPIEELLQEPEPSSLPPSLNIQLIDKFLNIPIIGRIHAGQPIIAEQNITGYTHIPADEGLTGKMFALQVEGDSMFPEINNGDLCIVRVQPTVEKGEIGVFMINSEEVTIRRFYSEKDNICLHATNPIYPPIMIQEDNKHFRILGRVILSQKRF